MADDRSLNLTVVVALDISRGEFIRFKSLRRWNASEETGDRSWIEVGLRRLDESFGLHGGESHLIAHGEIRMPDDPACPGLERVEELLFVLNLPDIQLAKAPAGNTLFFG